jgi:LDH2 family malate/lactate/ureidoglycolate dehydrogenase
VGLARRFGVSLVAVGGSSHFGCAGYYARMAAHAGQVAVVMTNSVKRMAPYGAAAPFLGTNPVAVGIPLPGRDPFVLDLSTSAEAGGKIMRAKERGEPIPPGVALDSEGRPTIDPAEALAGSLLPIAGAKGSGLALAVSLMAVLLAGAESDDVLAPMHGDLGRPQNVGHVFILADVEKIAAPDGDQRVGEMVERLHRLPPVPGGRAVRYPGEGATARLDTVSLDIAELEAAAATCRECGLDALGDEVLRLGQLPVAGEAACG